MKKESKLLSYIFMVFGGIILGPLLFLFHLFADNIENSFVILACMVIGGIIANLLRKRLNDQRKREAVIKEEQKRLNRLLDCLPAIVILIEENYKVRFANRNYTTKFGKNEGQFCYEVAGKNSPCDHCLLEQVFKNDSPLVNEELLFDNRIYETVMQPFQDVDGSKLVIKTLYDITERKEAEKELRRMHTEMANLERLNLVGQMSAGIAHEIRNPMTTVRGYLQLLGAKREFQSFGSMFELMIEEIDRANLIITDFLSFAKNSPTDRRSQNINDILRHLYPLLEADTITQNKLIVFEPGETFDILLDANEISQLVLNLCRNGLEAMQVGGTLKIRTYIDNEDVVLSIEDEGCGLSLEDIERLGTPFFTTKENGTGLGLATCYSIADRHNARIDFKSGSGRTTFFVHFPCP